MIKRLGVSLVAVLLSACVRTVHTGVSRGRPPVAAETAVSSAMSRQVRNAIYAGEGDLRSNELWRRVAADPDNLQLRLELARHYERIGFPEIAVEHLRLASARLPDSQEAAIELSKALRGLHLRPEALSCLEDFERRHPRSSPQILTWIGILQEDQGDLRRAEESYRAAIALQPESDLLHNNLGYNLLRQGRTEDAIAELREALRIAPQSPIARNNLGVALASQPDEAVLHWQSVSDPATAHNNLAAILIEKGRYPDARKQLDIALGYKNNHAAALRNLQLVSELDGLPAEVNAAAPAARGRDARRGSKRLDAAARPGTKDAAK
jgi:tetratricopeptide (TPR) repeat protein